MLDYQIADAAVYSDGKPITCDDMVLTWAAQSGRFPGFNAASKAGYLDIAGIECQPGQKKARVNFPAGPGDRGLQPTVHRHLADALACACRRPGPRRHRRNPERRPGAVGRIAEAWNTTWSLRPDIDLKRFPSSGPYKIESVLPEERWS